MRRFLTATFNCLLLGVVGYQLYFGVLGNTSWIRLLMTKERVLAEIQNKLHSFHAKANFSEMLWIGNRHVQFREFSVDLPGEDIGKLAFEKIDVFLGQYGKLRQIFLKNGCFAFQNGQNGTNEVIIKNGSLVIDIAKKKCKIQHCSFEFFGIPVVLLSPCIVDGKMLPWGDFLQEFLEDSSQMLPRVKEACYRMQGASVAIREWNPQKICLQCLAKRLNSPNVSGEDVQCDVDVSIIHNQGLLCSVKGRGCKFLLRGVLNKKTFRCNVNEACFSGSFPDSLNRWEMVAWTSGNRYAGKAIEHIFIHAAANDKKRKLLVHYGLRHRRDFWLRGNLRKAPVDVNANKIRQNTSKLIVNVDGECSLASISNYLPINDFFNEELKQVTLKGPLFVRGSLHLNNGGVVVQKAHMQVSTRGGWWRKQGVLEASAGIILKGQRLTVTDATFYLKAPQVARKVVPIPHNNTNPTKITYEHDLRTQVGTFWVRGAFKHDWLNDYLPAWWQAYWKDFRLTRDPIVNLYAKVPWEDVQTFSFSTEVFGQSFIYNKIPIKTFSGTISGGSWGVESLRTRIDCEQGGQILGKIQWFVGGNRPSVSRFQGDLLMGLSDLETVFGMKQLGAIKSWLDLGKTRPCIHCAWELMGDDWKRQKIAFSGLLPRVNLFEVPCENVRFGGNFHDNQCTVQTFQGNVPPKGTFQASGMCGNGKVFQGKVLLNDVAANPLLVRFQKSSHKTNLGLLDADFSLRVNDGKDIKGMASEGKFALHAADLGNFYLFGMLSKMLGNMFLNFGVMTLDRIKCNFALKEGVLSSNNLVIKGPSVKIAGGGTVALETGALDINLHTSPMQLVPISFVRKFLDFVLPVKNIFALSISLEGTFSQPEWKVYPNPFHLFDKNHQSKK